MTQRKRITNNANIRTRFEEIDVEAAHQQLNRELGGNKKQKLREIEMPPGPSPKSPKVKVIPSDNVVFKTPTKTVSTPKKQKQIITSPLKSRKSQLKSRVPIRKTGKK